MGHGAARPRIARRTPSVLSWQAPRRIGGAGMTGSRRAPVIANGGGSIIVTGEAQQRAWQTRPFPPPEQGTPRVWSLPATLPDQPPRSTLCYLLRAPPRARVL